MPHSPVDTWLRKQRDVTGKQRLEEAKEQMHVKSGAKFRNNERQTGLE